MIKFSNYKKDNNYKKILRQEESLQIKLYHIVYNISQALNIKEMINNKEILDKINSNNNKNKNLRKINLSLKLKLKEQLQHNKNLSAKINDQLKNILIKNNLLKNVD